MLLSYLLLVALLIFSSVLAELPTPNCTPHADHETCLLYWITNTGIDINFHDDADFEAWAHATIYSPDCTPWGATTNGLGTDVKVLAWGLSITDPLVLNPAVVEGVGYNAPQFSYDGQVWGYEDCECGVGEIRLQTHICRCPFKCEDVPVIG